MDHRLDRIDKKLDRMDDKIDKIDTHLAVYNEQLKIHIKRTELIETDLTPIKDHVNQVKGIIKFIGVIGTIIGISVAIKSLL